MSTEKELIAAGTHVACGVCKNTIAADAPFCTFCRTWRKLIDSVCPTCGYKEPEK